MYEMYEKTLGEYKSAIDAALAGLFLPRGDAGDGLREAMRYSLLAPGKRIRGILALAFARACGGEIRDALPAALAVELLHAYSLIHDDLPCMDDDELRRGRPTNHIVYGECTATLAGDALQAEAFHMILTSGLPAERMAKCAEILSSAAGSEGICMGQYLDMLAEERPPETAAQLEAIHTRKTGALIAAACRMGVASAGGPGEALAAAHEYGSALGMAFQIRDDVLDATAETASLGKPAGSDEREGKTTYMSLFGEEKCAALVSELTGRAVRCLGIFPDADFLKQLAEALSTRDN